MGDNSKQQHCATWRLAATCRTNSTWPTPSRRSNAVESLVLNILTHFVLLAADPDVPATRAEIVAWNVALRRRISPSMRGRLDIGGPWRDALRIAEARLASWDQGKASAVARLHGTPCLFAAADFGTDDDLAAAGMPARIQLT
jgi:hypothetical protein